MGKVHACVFVQHGKASLLLKFITRRRLGPIASRHQRQKACNPPSTW